MSSNAITGQRTSTRTTHKPPSTWHNSRIAIATAYPSSYLETHTKDDKREELEISGEVPWTWREVLLVPKLWVMQYSSNLLRIIQTVMVIFPAGCPSYTLLEKLWMRILQRNTIPSASRIGRSGTAWFDCGVAIAGSKKPAYPSPFSTAALPSCNVAFTEPPDTSRVQNLNLSFEEWGIDGGIQYIL
ncbi:hypothetical protein BDZ45DRAFT_302268 [Acephala macrosclerotiorum]|nr:hypothetical protein BDZ45DRAFT_302268 [Acephala macrosclerotiorum]